MNLTKRFYLYLFLFLPFFAVAQLSFTNVAGIGGDQSNIDFNKDGGASFADYDLDGDLDLVVNTNSNNGSRRSYLLRNDNGIFTNQSVIAPGLKSSLTERTVAWGDFNNDGYPDLLVNGNDELKLLRNDGGVGFTVIFDIDTMIDGMNTEGAGFIDYDLDGDLDFFVENHNHGVDLFENNGNTPNPVFTQITVDAVGATGSGAGGIGLPEGGSNTGDYGTSADINRDGYPDILVRRQGTSTSVNLDNNDADLFINNGDGTFTPNGSMNENAANNNKGGVVTGDFDNDGDFDILWTSASSDGNRAIIYENTGANSMVFAAISNPFLVSNGNPEVNTSFDGCTIGDIDNDGDLDIFMTQNSGTSKLFLNLSSAPGNFSFRQPGPEWISGASYNYGININQDGEGCVFVDYDNDGDLDLYVNKDQNNQLWRNNYVGSITESNATFQDSYLRIIAEKDLGGGLYRAALNATVKLVSCSGSILNGVREVSSGGASHGSVSGPWLHFGLKNGPNRTYLVEVTFPRNGTTPVVVRKSVTPSELVPISLGASSLNLEQTIIIRDTDANEFLSCDIDNDGILDFNDLDNDNDGIIDFSDATCDSPNAQFISTVEAFWPLDNNFNDASGNGNNGTGTNSVTFSNNAIEGTHSVVMDAFFDRIRLSGTNVMTAATSTISFSVWYQPTSATGNRILYEEGGPNDGAAITMSNTTLTYRTANAGVFTNLNHPTPLTADGLWHHIAGIFDNGVMTLYLDGVAVNTTALYTEIPAHTNQGGIGNRGNSAIFNSGDPIRGFIDAIRYTDEQAWTPEIVKYEALRLCDTDGDGIFNHLDLDSDNDGCFDALEGDAPESQIGYTELNPDGSIAGAVDSNGVPNTAAGGQGIGTSIDSTLQANECSSCDVNNPQYVDTDGDLVGDFCDLDDDNDGILDVNECLVIPFTSTEPNNWNITNANVNTSNIGLTPRVDTITPRALDAISNQFSGQGNTISFDEDPNYTFINMPNGVINTGNFYDDPDDNPDLGQIYEELTYADTSWSVESTFDLAGFDFTQFPNFTLVGEFYSDDSMDIYLNGNLIASPSNLYYEDPEFFTTTLATSGAINAGINTIRIDVTNNANSTTGLVFNFEINFGCDSDVDADGVANQFDLDSDNDGCNDVNEAGYTDINGDGQVDGSGFAPDGTVSGSDGYNGTSPNVTDDSVSIACQDTDGDGVPDSLDIDDDNDGIADTNEQDCTSTTPGALGSATVLDLGSAVTGVYTDYQGWWASSTASINPVQPNLSHNLLAFEVGGTVFTTGILNSRLLDTDANGTVDNMDTDGNGTPDLPVEEMRWQAFLPSNTISNELTLDASNNDGNVSTALGNSIINDVTTDPLNPMLYNGKQGLDLGTGLANIGDTWYYSVAGVNAAELNDGKPDILITQVAQPSTVFYTVTLYDGGGSAIGNAVRVSQSAGTISPIVGTYRTDVYNVNGALFGSQQNEPKDIRMATIELSEFGLNTSNIADVALIELTISSGADTAFLAYNADAFWVCTDLDSDNDGIPNRLDIDSDNDGIYDLVEAGNEALDTDGDGDIDADDTGFADIDQNGMDDSAQGTSPTDTDGDGFIDTIEQDADNDGCNDANEAGYTDNNDDGEVDGTGYATNGMVLASDGYTTPADADSNGTYDFQEVGTAPTITTQPTNLTLCPGCTGSFTAATTDADTFQWQIFNGTDWVDLSDGGIYSGSASVTLSIAQPTTAENNSQYRLLAASSTLVCTQLISTEVTLTIHVTSVITNRQRTYRVNKN